MVDPFTAVGTASAVLDLAKELWKLGSALVKLYQDTKCVDNTVKALAGEVKSLGNECDLVHAELEPVVTASQSGKPSPYDQDGRLWSCLSTKIEDCREVVHALEHFVKDVAAESSNVLGQAQRQLKLDKNKEKVYKLRLRVRTHTDGLRTALLVINIKVAHIAPGNASRELTQKLDRLQTMVEKMQKSMDGNTMLSHGSDADATLVQCAREVITKGTTMYEESLPSSSVYGGQRGAHINSRVAEWIHTLDSLRRDDRRPLQDRSDVRSTRYSVFSDDTPRDRLDDVSFKDHNIGDPVDDSELMDDSDDEPLAVDLAKAALETSTQAFDAEAWTEADALLQETLRRLLQLSKQHRLTFDTFDIQYKLAVCSYHTQAPADAVPALASLLQLNAESDEQRGQIYEVTHLLTLLYIRLNHLERARAQCEKALQARWRLYGKQSDPSLTSVALMVRILEMQNNAILAKVFLAMIPEDRRTDIFASVDNSLKTNVPTLDESDLLAVPASPESDVTRPMDSLTLASSTSPMASSDTDARHSVTTIVPSSSATEYTVRSNREDTNTLHELDPMVSGALSVGSQERLLSHESVADFITDVRDNDGASHASTDGNGPGDQTMNRSSEPEELPRQEVLENLRVKPKTALEKAIVFGDPIDDLAKAIQDHPKRSSGLRRQFKMKPTPLHYAALFGEVEMARQILRHGTKSMMNVDLPSFFLWTLGTPFHWAVLARQATILELFLKAQPSLLLTLAQAPDMSKPVYQWWLSSTVSASESSHGKIVPEQYIEMVRVLLKYGWDVNQGISHMQWTLLHYAAWLGREYDPQGLVVTFLCRKGALPGKKSADGSSAYAYTVQEPVAREIMEYYMVKRISKQLADGKKQ